MTSRLVDSLLALAVLALSLVVGVAAFGLGFLAGDSPCVLCWAQRTAMALVALVGLFILRFGPRPRYVGLGLLVAAHGLYMAVRHGALHAARDVGQGFSVVLLGAHTYTWSALIFWVAVVLIGLLLLLLGDGGAAGAARPPGRLARLAHWVFLVAIACNAVQAFASTGPPPFMGQGDPVRFSFSPRHWVWSLEEWQPAPLSWRGRWQIERPSLAGLDSDPGRGPLAGLPVLAAKRHLTVPLPEGDEIVDLAHEPTTDRFVAATRGHGIVVLDGGLARIARAAVVDPLFSVDLDTFGGVAWLSPDRVIALGRNKSWVVVREQDGADPIAGFRHFLAGADRFAEVGRGRFATVRARMQYVEAVAADPAAGALYTVTVPNRRHRRLAVSRFDARDMTLSEEFLPALAAGGALAGEGRSADEYHITGLAVAGGRLLAVSAAFSTLLEIDPARREISAAWALAGVEGPVGLAVRGAELWVAGAGHRVAVFDRPPGAATATEADRGGTPTASP